MMAAVESVVTAPGSAASAEAEASDTGHPSIAAFGAFLLYLAASVLLWGRPVLAHFASRYVAGNRGDPDFYRWALKWTPWALTHHESILFTDRVFAPQGVDLSWTALVPGPALVAWPVTAAFGTLASYNLLMLFAPALAAWAAYLVGRRVTGSFWASLAGGYLFGFATYMTGQMQAHLNLVLIFPVPLAVYLVIRVVEGSLGRWWFVGLMSLTLLGLLSISTELFATTILFGGIAFVLALIAAGTVRPDVVRAIALTGLACGIVVALVWVPYLLPILRHAPADPIRPLDRASADLLGFVVPHGELVGGNRFASVTDRFTARRAEDASYIGLAGLAVLVGFATTERRRAGTWALLGFVVVGSLLALGPVLHIVGTRMFVMPGALIAHTPLVRNATPQRFPAYTALAIGVIVAIWLARARGRWAWVRWVIVAVAAASLLPTIHSPDWFPPDRTPGFFADGTYASVLAPNENVFVISGSNGEEMMWQASADLSFRMPEGYIGAIPPTNQDGRLSKGLSAEDPFPFVPGQEELSAWLARHQVSAVVLSDNARANFEPVLRAIGLEPVYRGAGVSVWR
jgi:hypothetical protein